MLIDHFAITREDDAASSPGAAQPGGTGEPLPAVEPVGIVGGHPVPAPAAADLDLSRSDLGRSGLSRSGTRGEPDPGGVRIAASGLGEAAVDRFVCDYLQMLDGRLDAIRRCLADSDVEGARVAVLSLESSSAMLGGDTLAARLGELRHQLDLGSAPQRNALMTLVEAAASTFRRDLQGAERA